MIEHCISLYKLWYGYRDQFPKKSRYTLGDTMDKIFIETLELLSLASYQSKEEKLPSLERALRNIDVLKFFSHLAWDLHILDDKKFILLSEKLLEVGRMLGGWRKGLATKTPVS